MKKDTIEKIDEQIQDLLNVEKEVYEEKDSSKEDGHVVFVDRLEQDTKRINHLDELESIEETEEIEEKEKTEKITKVEDLPENKVDKEEKDSTTIKKSGKKKLILLFLIIGLFLVIIFGLILLIFHSKGKEKVEVEKEKTLSKSDQEEIITGYGDALKGIIAVYYDKQNVLLEYDDAVKLVNYDYKIECKEHEIYENGFLYLNQCRIDNKKTDCSYGEKQEKKEEPVISEDAIKVYVSKNNQKTTLIEPKNLDEYDVYSFTIDEAYTDLTLLNEAGGSYVFYTDEDYLIHMINFKTGKKVLDVLNYTSILPIKFEEEYDPNYIAVSMNQKWGIYDLRTNERVVSHKYDNVSPLLYMGTSGPASFITALEDGIIAVVNYGYDYSDIEYGVINYRTGEEIISSEYQTMLHSGKYLWAVDAYGDGHIFDHFGKEYLANQYDTIYWAVDGKYILVQDKENTKLVSIKGKELYNYGTISIGNINYGLTYKDGAIFQFDNPEKEEDNYETDCVEVIYDSSSKEGEVKTSYCGGIAKPVLYLYPKKTTNVTISFEHPEYLDTTYPKYYDKWEVIAHNNGDLYDKNGNYYYALYWDEFKVHDVDFHTGYYVEKEDAISFLEKKLEYIGLSPKEKNEFIMYWLPILEKNEKSLVYFELTEERNRYHKINITPKPDSILRLVIHIKKVNQKVDIPKQNLTRFQRKGFVAVEWGGVQY